MVSKGESENLFDAWQRQLQKTPPGLLHAQLYPHFVLRNSILWRLGASWRRMNTKSWGAGDGSR